MITPSVACGIINVNSFISGCQFNVCENALPNFLICMSTVIPPIVVYFLGPEYCFSLVARQFEYNTIRLQKDGSLMAVLVSTTQAVDTESLVRWLKRKKDDTNAKPSPENCVVRKYWIHGKIQPRDTTTTTTTSDAADLVDEHSVSCGNVITELVIKYYYDTDKDENFVGRYTDDKMELLQLSNDALVSNRNQMDEYNKKEDYYSWCKNNFNEEDILEFDIECFSYVSVTAKVISTLYTEDSLLDWAKDNLKFLPWKNFSDELLLKSPRELACVEEKRRIYALSKEISTLVSRDGKIDFFVSHSWEDDAVYKCKVLRQFAEEFRQKHHRYPTFWLDKVCINQEKPGDGLAVLPINIGACRKVLILMSRTYVKRLWCIWELFMLFTFCNKELAVERIEILPIVNEDHTETVHCSSPFDVIKEFDEFDLDNAHCFDPNEEYKLRHIIYQIGKQKLTDSIRILVITLKRSRENTRAIRLFGTKLLR